MSFLQIEGKNYLVFGVYNKKSIAYHAAKVIEAEGGVPILVVKDNTLKAKVHEFCSDNDIFVCDVENQDEIKKLVANVSDKYKCLHGMVHSVAFADFSEGFKPFHETKKAHFLQSIDISCFSLINLSNELKDLFDKNASVVTLTVPFTKTVVENYSYMAPVKAALESSVAYLAKSFSYFSQIRFNAVSTGFVKTSAAAGIPQIAKSFLFAEKVALRKQSIEAREVADIIVFLLSKRSCLINAQSLVADDGLSINIFDNEVVEALNKQH